MKNRLYLDPDQPIQRRTKDLLSYMTLREKVQQLGSCWSYQFIQPNGVDAAAFGRYLCDGIGQVTRVAGTLNQPPQRSAEICNAIQRYLLEETRLGIPAIFHDECLTSFMSLQATVFPQMIGIAASFDPNLAHDMGITLTAADTMVFYSMDYSMSNFEQAKARIHRVGQRNPCTYIYLVAVGTIDEKVLQALRDKADLARALIDEYRTGKNPFDTP